MNLVRERFRSEIASYVVFRMSLEDLRFDLLKLKKDASEVRLICSALNASSLYNGSSSKHPLVIRPPAGFKENSPLFLHLLQNLLPLLQFRLRNGEGRIIIECRNSQFPPLSAAARQRCEYAFSKSTVYWWEILRSSAYSSRGGCSPPLSNSFHD